MIGSAAHREPRRRPVPRRVVSVPIITAIASLLISSLLMSCAGPPQTTDNDPAEPVNRAIFKANLAADHAVLHPVAQAYVDHVPAAVRQGVHNIVQNFGEPATVVNDLLQGHVVRAGQSVGRLAINTTIGAAGMFDIAKKWGIPPHNSDFGETLAGWGVGAGPFVELPLLGPSDSRDAVGTVVDLALNPLTYVGGAPATYASVAAGSADVVDTRARHLKDLDALERNSLDYYAALRSAYLQHRAAQIAAAKAPQPPPPPGQVQISFPDSAPR
ncbi:MAG TPA: VacJ family lipoprotein [Stellaceae bacterium]|nr:VacJ family lipoprotein [Stellaceae bacterium]